MNEPNPVKDAQQAVAVIEEKAIERAKPAPTVADMLQAVVEKGVSEANVHAVEKIVELYERMQLKEAEKAFAAAFNALQSEIPKVKAVQPVPNKDGTVRYKFAPYEEIMEQVRPLLLKHGFTVSFSTEYEGPRVVKTCILQHVGGHIRTNKFAARIGQGPPGSSEAQGDGAASSYAKRFALCDALNIVCEKDSDARLEGTPITPQQAEELARRVAMTNSDKDAFLELAGVKTFAEIPSMKYDMLDQLLSRKERKGR